MSRTRSVALLCAGKAREEVSRHLARRSVASLGRPANTESATAATAGTPALSSSPTL